MNLLMLYGPPAAGKLTVATELSKELGYKLFDNHQATDYLNTIFPRSTDQKLEHIRSSLGRKLRIDVFEAAAQANIDLITTFAPLSPGTHDFLRAVRAAVENAGGSVLFVQLLPRRDVLLERVTAESRLGKKIDNHRRWNEVVGNNAAAFETFPDVVHCVLDNSTISPAEAAAQIMEYYTLHV